MQIWDAAGTASALHDLITHNRLAWQLACAWDDRHPNHTPIVLVCEKIRDDWKKMVWLNRALSLLESLQVFALVVGAVALVASTHWMSWYFIPVMVFFGLLFWVDLCLVKAIRRKIGKYCELGIPLRDANNAIQGSYNDYKDYGDVQGLLKLLDDICFEIVRLEKLGLEDTEFVNPFPRSNHYDRCQVIDLKVLRNRFTELVSVVSAFGLATSDLRVHFATAQKRWDKQVTSGEILTDFQI